MEIHKHIRNTVFLILSIFSSASFHAQVITDSIYTHADQMPYFYGCSDIGLPEEARRQCSDKELVRFISRQLEYPEAARVAGVEGTVYVSFVIDERGKVVQTQILKDIGSGCGEAALELLNLMPPWSAAIYRGEKVRIKLNLPIQFSLRAPESDLADAFTVSWGNLSGSETTKEELLECLKAPLQVRDIQGDLRYVDELSFSFERGKRLAIAKSRGTITSDIEKLLKKVKRGGIFSITASVQDMGQFIYITRSFKVVN